MEIGGVQDSDYSQSRIRIRMFEKTVHNSDIHLKLRRRLKDKRRILPTRNRREVGSKCGQLSVPHGFFSWRWPSPTCLTFFTHFPPTSETGSSFPLPSYFHPPSHPNCTSQVVRKWNGFPNTSCSKNPHQADGWYRGRTETLKHDEPIFCRSALKITITITKLEWTLWNRRKMPKNLLAQSFWVENLPLWNKFWFL